MKYSRLLTFLFAISFLLTSCYDAVQKIQFTENGGGNTSYSIDFSKGLAMVKAFIPDSIQQSPDFSKKVDTTFTLIDVMPDSLKKTKSEEALRMLSATIINMNMDMASNQFKVEFKGTSNNEAELRYRLQNLDKELSATDNIAGGAKGLAGGASSGLNTDYFIYEYKKGYFKRTVDTAAFNRSLAQNSAIYEMMQGSGLDANFVLEMMFPKSVKKYKSTLLTLSSDKKVATLKYSMKEAIKTPSIMNVEIEY
ncbi:hypothetical protein C3K47_00050 [Solitalea longa]|uniref:Lipoprotein n=1 Tax=Solitalea longa TaxID=2079460 RepID=A0A2S5A8L4_9SPHI|nr:hypothetical protein [Solitalea longa]POY38931.1 hypothetical protein C3K47_00050 [Solitalea longa]